MMMSAGDGRAIQPKLGVNVPPAKMNAPKGAAIFDEAPRAVNLAPRSG
jgi:hypothetical protein